MDTPAFRILLVEDITLVEATNNVPAAFGTPFQIHGSIPSTLYRKIN